ncbi:MAG: glycine cleavage system protein GcvH [Candidatus Izemoplasmataceae bacterium]|jgi:glycine cleavage system H protein|uniref:glycine cleavage system protein GcvH n=1 Tax=Liberiplasma polymorphum TaxID=3374570 RepID=UPI0037725D7A
MNIPKDLYYTESHEWVRVEDGFAYIGITDYAQESLGEIVFIELPEENEQITQFSEFAAIESVKAASDLNAPLSGVIVLVNEELEDSPELLNEDSYENWIIKIEIEDESELNKLLNAAEYAEVCE